MTLRVGALFAGTGALELALADVLDVKLDWYAELDKAASKIMARHWPDVPNHGDVTRIAWPSVAPVDILTGGSPCQDISNAGKRAGMRPGTRSGLWESMREAIAVIRPRLVMWENVGAVLSASAHSDMEPCPGCVGNGPGQPALRALGRVVGDLASIGYDTWWTSLRASDVGAPHGRLRVFLFATPADTDDVGWAGWAHSEFRENRLHAAIGGTVSNLTLLPTPTSRDWKDGASADADVPENALLGRVVWRVADSLLPTPCASEAGGQRDLDHRAATGSQMELSDDVRQPERWGEYAAAVARWERTFGRPAPDPTVPAPRGRQRLNPALTEWMMGLPDGWVTDTPGISRNDQLKACGNGVVPQQAAAALHQYLTQGRSN